MKIDLYSATGAKKGSLELPAMLFDAPINEGLMHQAVIRVQGNRRNAIANTKTRSELRGSSRKIYAQKGTGRARHGTIRGNVMRGGNKSFGPKSNANFTTDMPQKMRHQALFSSLSLQAKSGAIIGLEDYPQEMKTKKMSELLGKLPVELGRNILVVLPAKHKGLSLSVRNIPRVKAILVDFLNPEEVLRSRYIVILADAVKRAEEVFGTKKKAEAKEKKPRAEKRAPKKASAPKATKKASTPKAPKKTSSTSKKK